MTPLDQYDKICAPFRDNLRKSNVVNNLLSGNDKKTLHAFWIFFSGIGVSMTEQVEGWIKRAGQACEIKGFNTLGKNLIMHSKQEKDHHFMMVEDCENLVKSWNSQYSPHILFEKSKFGSPLEASPYIHLHEEIIKSQSPFRQIAVEFEIEQLSLDVGNPLIEATAKALGNDFIENLSFLTDHAALDVGHTKFNREQLNRFLTEHPEALPDVVFAASDALRSYEFFLSGCLQKATLLVQGHLKSVKIDLAG